MLPMFPRPCFRQSIPIDARLLVHDTQIPPKPYVSHPKICDLNVRDRQNPRLQRPHAAYLPRVPAPNGEKIDNYPSSHVGRECDIWFLLHQTIHYFCIFGQQEQDHHCTEFSVPV